MGEAGTAPARMPGYRHRALASLLCFWVLASFLAIGGALQSDWAPFGELPTPEQAQQARMDAWAAGAVSVVPPVLGLLLARRWRSSPWAAVFLVGLTGAVLVSALLVLLTGSPARPR